MKHEYFEESPKPKRVEDMPTFPSLHDANMGGMGGVDTSRGGRAAAGGVITGLVDGPLRGGGVGGVGGGGGNAEGGIVVGAQGPLGGGGASQGVAQKWLQAQRAPGRGLHSSAFQLNLIHF